MEPFLQKLGKISFRTRIRLGMLTVIALIIILSMSVTTFLQNRDQIKSMDKLGTYIAANLAQNSTLGLLSEEPDNLVQPLDAATAEHQVVGASVYLANGKLLKSKKHLEYSLDNLEASEQLAVVSSTMDLPVIIKTQTGSGQPLRSYLAKVVVGKSDSDVFNIETEQYQFYGFVRVDMSLDTLAEKKAAILYQNLLLMPIYVLIGILFSLVIEHHISRPLTQLKTAVGAITEGDFSAKINIQTEDEIGLLAKSFNNMSQQLSVTIDELNNANECLVKANRELQEFTYIVSHDLQEPLRKVHSFGQFLIEDYHEQLPEQGKGYVRRMQNATIKMKNLIQDLLKLSRVSTSKEKSTPIDSNEALNEALDDLLILIDESRAEIVVEQLPVVLAGHTQLVQLLENLISNAIKYRSSERKPRIEIKAKQQGKHVIFSIKDNGIGIEERFHEKIFGVFQRLHNEYKGGTGIGLALCKKVVTRYGGRIWVKSKLGVGTTFYFTLPKATLRKGVLEHDL